MKSHLKYSFIFVLLLSVFSTRGQIIDTNNVIGQISKYLLYRNHDTNYISNYGDEVGIKLLTNNKFNYLRIRDRENNTSYRYRPSRDLSIGIGMVYKWFALDIAFALGLRNNSQIEDARAFDFQGRLFTSKQFISITLQYYKGYKLANINGVDVDLSDSEALRSDMRTLNFGIDYLYALNYTKFSMKAPFVFNEIQRKSAGSPIVGASFGIYSMSADSSLLPPSARSAFQPNAQIRDLSLVNASLNVGYMYTLVYKSHYFLTVSLIPGLNLNAGDYFDEASMSRDFIPLNAHLKINSLNAIGYNGRRVFGGLSFAFEANYSRIAKKLTAETGQGIINLFIGYRFDAPKFMK